MQTTQTDRPNEVLSVTDLLGTVAVYLHTLDFFDSILLTPVQARRLAREIRTGQRTGVDTQTHDTIRTAPYPDATIMSIYSRGQYGVITLPTIHAETFCDELDAAANRIGKVA